jgi:predicted AlkP superfamily pyrophosphatase or phosphodiesterase
MAVKHHGWQEILLKLAPLQVPQKKLLAVNVAALGWNIAGKIPGFSFQKAESVFPALTCSAQASFRTAAPPQSHGMVSNGLFFADLRRVLFWEQSSALVHGARIWEKFRSLGGRAGMMFWQQSLGEDVDLLFSPAPIHKHGGGMIQDCYCQPGDLQQRLDAATGRRFNLMHYWGPLASRKSSDWIVDATLALLDQREIAPDLLLTYLPHLDYDLQRYGPCGPQAAKALDSMADYLRRLREKAEARGYEWLVFGDYAIEPVMRGAIFPNWSLRKAGLFSTRTIKGMSYADFFASRAFAVADHQIAHVHTAGPGALEKAREVLQALEGVAAVLDRGQQRERGVDHPRGGDLLLVAEAGAWFAYPWWLEKDEEPDFATHVDIHNKPGYDPCELFFGWPPLSVSQDVNRIRGTHGRGGESNAIAWASSIPFERAPATFVELASVTKSWLET